MWGVGDVGLLSGFRRCQQRLDYAIESPGLSVDHVERHVRGIARRDGNPLPLRVCPNSAHHSIAAGSGRENSTAHTFYTIPKDVDITVV